MLWGGTEHATFVILSLRCDRFSSFHSQIPCRPRGKRQPTWPLRAKSGTQLLSLGWSSSRRKRTWRRSSCRQHRSLPQRPPPRRPPPLARVTPRPRGATLRSSICRSPALLLHPQLPLRPSPLRPSPLRPSPIHPSPIHPSPIRPSPIRPSPIRQPAALLLGSGSRTWAQWISTDAISLAALVPLATQPVTGAVHVAPLLDVCYPPWPHPGAEVCVRLKFVKSTRFPPVASKRVPSSFADLSCKLITHFLNVEGAHSIYSRLHTNTHTCSSQYGTSQIKSTKHWET